MLKVKISLFLYFLVINIGLSQDVPILDFSLNNFGQPQIEIEGKADHYYLLHAVHSPYFDYESITSLTLGVDGTMIISEPLSAFSQQNYTITEHPIADPIDLDEDGIDDITELYGMPNLAPINFAPEVPFEDGTTSIDDHETFSELSVIVDDISWSPFLNNQEFVKFAIVNQNSDNPEVYFINSKTHIIHAYFLNTIGIDQYQDDVLTGEIVYNPNEILPNGAIGSYAFNYSFGDAFDFKTTQETYELLAANMPYLNNNLVHFIGDQAETIYNNNYRDDYIGSRVKVVLESEVFADIDYIPFNQAEGYGFFRLMGLDDNPGSRDIVLYEALPNSLPRVGGIITSVVQTPLSHVNLRAIQDNLPNSYIKNPLEIDSIANLLNNYIYYKVEQDKYIIREATLDEVNAWYDDIRPTEEQIPERDLSFTEIKPLDSIRFEMSTAFGAKCSNVATMRTFGFPEGTIPNGFGVPFYFYDEFMKFNGFYEQAEEMINDPEFIANLEVKIEMLDDFRKDIRDGQMPQWMLDKLQLMHDAFPEGTPIRCRSSTNNEDLPGFSGAGLYTSKTQYPEEGHIKKSIKQVYASMWNFRAFDEREFYRVDHFIAAMGVLCHPNYNDEKSNGVGISLDPLYQTEGNFYLNTQVGEFLITNPDPNSIPEEILLAQNPDDGYFVLRNSNLVPVGELIMGVEYLNQLREYLQVIHDEFAILYNVVGAEGYGMDIEYKVTKDDQLIIKQARPWVSFWAGIKSTFDLAVTEVINPKSSSSLTDSEYVTVNVENAGLRELSDFQLSVFVDSILIEEKQINEELASLNSMEVSFDTPIDFSEVRDYELMVIVKHPIDGYDKNDTLINTISKIYHLDAGISLNEGFSGCEDKITIVANVSNFGEANFTNTQIEVTTNGLVTDTIIYSGTIISMSTVEIPIDITENLVQSNNDIQLKIISINGMNDQNDSNNNSNIFVDIANDLGILTLIINPDNWPEETSWIVQTTDTGETVASGSLDNDSVQYVEDFCVNNTSCYELFVFDSYGDGICCGFGEGNFSLLNSEGDTLIYNDGNFGSIVIEEFCPNDIIISTKQEELKNISIMPNPTNGEFSILWEKRLGITNPLKVELYNGLGRLLLRTESNLQVTDLSIEGYEAGYYYLKCYQNGEKKVFRLIKI